ncbi:helix-turn-helix domain-containing protein [Paracoccus sp. (in: a-proteobacteria)]|uniref:helix-turn-helix domain-containing protein n=1 Tax=Paracoccus sp. TaxID=267 RepID=UPI00391711A6
MTHPRDIKIGEAIRHRRRELGLTQQDVAKHIGVTYQQVQKYECAQTRVSASTLGDIADLLHTDIEYFFR